LNSGLTCHFWELAGWLVHMYNMHPDFERGNYGENSAYYNHIFIVVLKLWWKFGGILFYNSAEANKNTTVQEKTIL